LAGTLTLGMMQGKSLAKEELMQPNRIAAMLQPRDMQHQHSVEMLRRPSVGQRGHNEPPSPGYGTCETGPPAHRDHGSVRSCDSDLFLELKTVTESCQLRITKISAGRKHRELTNIGR
jgi:hypothetical protein